MESDRIKWDRKYREEGYFFSLAPSKFLSQALGSVKELLPGRRALDIACGEGRNSIFLAKEGFAVTGIDISAVGLGKGIERARREGVRVDFVEADLDSYLLTEEYDLVVNFNFLLRPLLVQVAARLSPGGVLILETIMDGPNLVGEHKKEFLLEPGELARILSALPGEVLYLEELPGELTPVARGTFRKKR